MPLQHLEISCRRCIVFASSLALFAWPTIRHRVLSANHRGCTVNIFNTFKWFCVSLFASVTISWILFGPALLCFYLFIYSFANEEQFIESLFAWWNTYLGVEISYETALCWHALTMENQLFSERFKTTWTIKVSCLVTAPQTQISWFFHKCSNGWIFVFAPVCNGIALTKSTWFYIDILQGYSLTLGQPNASENTWKIWLNSTSTKNTILHIKAWNIISLVYEWNFYENYILTSLPLTTGGHSLLHNCFSYCLLSLYKGRSYGTDNR